MKQAKKSLESPLPKGIARGLLARVRKKVLG